MFKFFNFLMCLGFLAVCPSLWAINLYYEKVNNNRIETTFDTMPNAFQTYTINSSYGDNNSQFTLQMNGDFPGTNCEALTEAQVSRRQCRPQVPGNIGYCYSRGNGNSDTYNLTGIRSGKYLRPRCKSQTSVIGDSYAVISNHSSDYGVGLFTYTGPKRGQPSTGITNPFDVISYIRAAHQNLAGTYVSAIIPKDERLRAFKCANGANCKFRIYMDQKVKVKRVPRSSGSTRYQLQQKVGFVIQRTTRIGGVYPGIEYVPLSFCDGHGCNSDYGTLSPDPMQNGRYFVGGRIHGVNGVTTSRYFSGGAWRTVSTFKSMGAATQSRASNSYIRFGVEVDWNKFIATLKHTVAHHLDTAVSNVSNSDVANRYGSGWSNRANWEVKKFHIGQEVLNENTTQRTYVGGSYKKIILLTTP